MSTLRIVVTISAISLLTVLIAPVTANARPIRAAVGGMCGGIAGFQCRKGLFCDFPVEAKCGAADRTGKCARYPQICPMIYAPVCGCDGKTYGNDCARKGAGVSKLHDGKC